MKQLLEKKDNKAEKYWIIGFRILGVFFFITAFVPLIKGYYINDLEKVPLDNTDRTLALVGFFLVWGSSYFGTVANKVGAFFNKIVN